MASEKPTNHPAGISRRGFLKGVGAGAVASGILQEVRESAGIADAQTKSTSGPGEVNMTLNVNGKDMQVKAEPRVTLLDALRNRLDVTGAKKVCDRATCGACTVMMGGDIVYACTVLAIEAQGHKIVTPEGLGTPDKMNATNEAFVKHDALQCGFCTPGFTMATHAFVRDHPNATLDQVRAGLGGNLCRCGTYAGITAAAFELAKNGGA